MKNKNLKGLWIIVLVTLLLVVVVLILGYQSFKATEKAAFDEFNQRQLVLGREAASVVALYFENLAGDMRALARLPEIQRLDEAPTRRDLQYMFYELEPWGVNDIAVLDADGVVRYNVKAPELEGVDFSWRKYYQEAKEMTSSDAYIIEFIEFKGVEAGQKGVLIAAPMFETTADENHPPPSGRFAGVVVGTLKLDTITQKFIAPVRSSERGHAFLIDDEFDVLWSADSSLFGTNLLEEIEGFPSFQQIVEKMSVGNSGVAEYAYYEFDDSSGGYARDKVEEKLVAYVPIQLGNELWIIGVWAPKEDARQLIRSAYLQQQFVVGLSILIILLGSAYALTISYRASKSLEGEVETKTRELKESHERLRTALDKLETVYAFQQSIIDGVAEPIMVVDANYQVTLMNRAAREFSPTSTDASGPMFCYQVSHQCEAPCKGTKHPCPMELVRESGKPATVIHEHYRKDGMRRFVEVVASPLWGTDGSFQGIIEATRDITERKERVEEMLATQAQVSVRSEDELGQFAHRVIKSLQDFVVNQSSD